VTLLGVKVHHRFGNADGNEVEMLCVDGEPHDGSTFSVFTSPQGAALSSPTGDHERPPTGVAGVLGTGMNAASLQVQGGQMGHARESFWNLFWNLHGTTRP
jgi:hypothetical protein